MAHGLVAPCGVFPDRDEPVSPALVGRFLTTGLRLRNGVVWFYLMKITVNVCLCGLIITVMYHQSYYGYVGVGVVVMSIECSSVF